MQRSWTHADGHLPRRAFWAATLLLAPKPRPAFIQCEYVVTPSVSLAPRAPHTRRSERWGASGSGIPAEQGLSEAHPDAQAMDAQPPSFCLHRPPLQDGGNGYPLGWCGVQIVPLASAERRGTPSN